MKEEIMEKTLYKKTETIELKLICYSINLNQLKEKTLNVSVWINDNYVDCFTINFKVGLIEKSLKNNTKQILNAFNKEGRKFQIKTREFNFHKEEEEEEEKEIFKSLGIEKQFKVELNIKKRFKNEENYEKSEYEIYCDFFEINGTEWRKEIKTLIILDLKKQIEDVNNE